MRIPITSQQLIFADNVCDYIIIPGVSLASNLSVIFQKCLIHCFPKLVRRYHWFQHIKDKSLMRCVVLLVPVLGSIAVAIHDYKNKSKKTASEEQPSSLLALPVEQRLEFYNFFPDESLIDLAQTCRTIYSEVINEKSLNKKMMLNHAFNMVNQIPYSLFSGSSQKLSAISEIMKIQLRYEDDVEAAKISPKLGIDHIELISNLRALQISKDILNISPTGLEMKWFAHFARKFAQNGKIEEVKKVFEILSKNNYRSCLKVDVHRYGSVGWSPDTTFVTNLLLSLVILENYDEIEELIESNEDVSRTLFFNQALLFSLAERGKIEQIKKFIDKIKFGNGDPRQSGVMFIRSLSYLHACCSTHSIPEDFDAHIELILEYRDAFLNHSYMLNDKLILIVFDIAYFLMKINKNTFGFELINLIPKVFFKDTKFLTSLYEHQLAANQKAAAEETVKTIKDKANDFFCENDHLRFLISLVLTKAKYQYFDECIQDLKDIQEIYRTGLLTGKICTKVMVLIAQAYTKINLTDDELKETLNDLKEISIKGIKDPFALCEVLSDIATLQNIHVFKEFAFETLCEARQISMKINNKHEKAKAFALFAYSLR